MDRYDSIEKYFSLATAVVIHADGKTTKYTKEFNEYGQILSSLNNICHDCREMPAYGVSLDRETKAEIKVGLWLELAYDKTLEHNDMPFDTLLIKVEKDYQGFGIIRGNGGVYEGRCFHIYCPKNTMENLYDLLRKI